MARGLEHPMYEKPLKEPGFFYLEKIENEYSCSLPGGAIKKTDSSQRHTAGEQEAMNTNCSKENSCWIQKDNFTMQVTSYEERLRGWGISILGGFQNSAEQNHEPSYEGKAGLVALQWSFPTYIL
ncbi:hypothetical protein llap_12107 [Limosa lapponica baueri]|uniref:Uncharacterized protein n=1 Tax=Limosa lapponica baueri TaxID=1758121 RepID=A0A2I0TUZ2_LIMLA|nr:hypothetical protein llap_12107 [Limosa lapponica baueri]